MAERANFEHVNEFLLCKQHLTNDSKSNDVVQIVSDILGLHATSPIAPYLSLLARTLEFQKTSLERELYVERSLARVRCMRKTVFVLTKELVPIALAATRRMAQISSRQFAMYLGISERRYKRMARVILALLNDRGMTTSEVKKALGTRLNVSPILNLMCDEGLLVRGEVEGGWRSSLYRYYRFQDYFPDVELNTFGEEEARRKLVERYLASYGPATENDVSWWMGLPKREIRRILDGMQNELAHVRFSGLEGDCLITLNDRMLLESRERSDTETVNLLPCLDPYIMGYKGRQRYVPLKHWNMIFDRSGNSTSTIVVDGAVVGVWDFVGEPEPTIKLFIFEKARNDLLDRIYFEASSTGEFVAERGVRVEECKSMIPLTERTAGSVMTPLREKHGKN